MKNSELYQKTVDILVQAYFNHTLSHGDCAACAVGNIIAANNGYKLVLVEDDDIDGFVWTSADGKDVAIKWHTVFVTCGDDQSQEINLCNLAQEAKKQLSSTGYHWSELAEMELAFETADKGDSEDEYMFNGLMRVVDVLDRIHENNDAEVTNTSKRKFVKQIA